MYVFYFFFYLTADFLWLTLINIYITTVYLNNKPWIHSGICWDQLLITGFFIHRWNCPQSYAQLNLNELYTFSTVVCE